MPVKILLNSALFASCAVVPPNVEVCVRLQDGAQCAYTIEGEDRKVQEAEWSDLGRFSLTAKDFGEIRAFIEKVCAKEGVCEQVDSKVEELMQGLDQ